MHEGYKWHDAKSALPPAGMRVIATDGAFVGEAYITDVGGNVVWYRSYGEPWEEFSGSPVTMWMDMPEVPAECAGDGCGNVADL